MPSLSVALSMFSHSQHRLNFSIPMRCIRNGWSGRMFQNTSSDSVFLQLREDISRPVVRRRSLASNAAAAAAAAGMNGVTRSARSAGSWQKLRRPRDLRQFRDEYSDSAAATGDPHQRCSAVRSVSSFFLFHQDHDKHLTLSCTMAIALSNCLFLEFMSYFIYFVYF